MKLFKHQKRIVKESCRILKEYGVVYNTSETRTGKTLMTLQTAKKLQVSKVLVVTTKAAIPDWYCDFRAKDYGQYFELMVTNYEQLKNMHWDYDMVVFDEATRLASLGKPSLTQNTVFAFMGNCKPKYSVLLSATPSVESTCQFYYPLKLCGYWTQYGSFFKWHKDYGTPATKRVSAGRTVVDYSKGKDKKILKYVKPIIVRATREEAAFTQHKTIVKEVVIKPLPITDKIYAQMMKDSMVGEVLGDTAVKKAQKLQQLCSGFMYDEEGTAIEFGCEKLEWLRMSIDRKQKTAIYCLYTYELELYRDLFRDVLLDYEAFKKAKTGVYISQVQTGARGLDLSSANRQIFTSNAWSGEVFSQACDRMHRYDRQDPVEVEVLTLGLIDSDIIERVKDKKSFQAKQLKDIK